MTSAPGRPDATYFVSRMIWFCSAWNAGPTSSARRGEVVLAFELRRVAVGRRRVVGDALEDVFRHLLPRAELVAHELAHADRVDADRVVTAVSARAASPMISTRLRAALLMFQMSAGYRLCVGVVVAAGRARRLRDAVHRSARSSAAGSWSECRRCGAFDDERVRRHPRHLRDQSACSSSRSCHAVRRAVA